jgi:hypothetical protein
MWLLMSHQIWGVLLYDSRVVVTATVIWHGSGFTHFGLLETLVIAHYYYFQLRTAAF